MAYTSEIEKLERRWKENPQGTVFAPLAEVYRKDGQLERAREILRQGLENNPDHIPGNIVLARCCLDLREDSAAEAAFGHVLQLDPENVIALKALGDITERQGRLAEAGQWLNRLVQVDPSNDDAREQLARVEAVRESAAALVLTTLPPSDAVESEAAAPPAPEPDPITSLDAESAEYDFPVAAESTAPDWDEPSAAVAPAAAEAIPTPVVDAIFPPPAPVHLFAEEEPSLAVAGLSLVPHPPVVEFEESDPAPASTVGGFESVEFDPSAAAEAITQEIPGVELQEVQAENEVNIPTMLTPLSESFVVPNEEVPAIELQSAGGSEFQGPDHGEDLLTVQAAGFSEFQEPDAAADLGMRGSAANEFQSPSGSEELLNASGGGAEFQSVADPASELAAAMSESEFQAVRPSAIDVPDEVVLTAETVEVGEELEVVNTVEAVETGETAEVVNSGDSAGTVEERGEIVTAEYAAVSASMAAAAPAIEPGMADEWNVVQSGAAPSAGDTEPPSPAGRLPLIFPEDAERAEPTPPRRLSQMEPVPATDREAAEPGVGEPEPILTETMAELYAEQGHREEALRVYRILVEQSPADDRLRHRMRALEQEAQEHSGGARRPAYAASATGGESVESFFRALVSARPGQNGEPGGLEQSATVNEERGPGAPTRPASDPLSLSAIFGEESAQMPATPAPPQPVPEPASPGGDPFSFDQFFGAKSPQSGGTSPPGRVTHPAGLEEDLDQFQNWLKSLKK